MIRIAYFQTDTKLVTQILSGPDIEGFPDPQEGTALALLLNDELSMPLYFDGTEFQPLPPSPAEGYVWNGPTLSWVLNLTELIDVHRNRVTLLRSVFFSNGFVFVPPGLSATWQVKLDEWAVKRIEALQQEILLASPEPANFTVFGSTEYFQINQKILTHQVTRAQAAEFCMRYVNAVKAIAEDSQDQLNGIRNAEILGQTNPTQALANLVELINAGWGNAPPALVA